MDINNTYTAVEKYSSLSILLERYIKMPSVCLAV